VARIAGIGRSTFYECFDDYSHAVAAAAQYATREIVAALEGVRGQVVGVGLLDSLCVEWVRFAGERPALLLCALMSDAAASQFVGMALKYRQQLVATESDARQSPPRSDSAAPSARPDEALALAVSACAIEVARSIALGALHQQSLARSGISAMNTGAAEARESGASSDPRPSATGLQLGPRSSLAASEAQRALAVALRMLLR